MRAIAILALAGLLAGCGADGEPERPEKRESAGVGMTMSITGTAEMGVVGRSR